MNQASSDQTNRREDTLRLEETRVKGECTEACVPDFAARVTEVVTKAGHIREAFELAATELSMTLSLVIRVVFIMVRALSLLWVVYLIFVKDWHPGGTLGLIVSVLSICVLMGHSLEIAKRILKSSREK